MVYLFQAYRIYLFQACRIYLFYAYTIYYNCKSVLKTTLKNKISISAWEGTGPFQSLYTNKYDNFAEIIFPTWTKRLIFLISLYFFIECKCQFKFVFYIVVINSLMQKIKCIPTTFNEKNRSIVSAHFLMSDIRCVYFRHSSLFLSLWLHEKLYRDTIYYTGTQFINL